MRTSTTLDAHPGRSRPDLQSYVAALAEEGARFASVAAAGGLDVPIGACPGWDMRELVRHVGMVHLWAAANIRFPSDRWLHVERLSDLERFWPEHTTGWPADAGLVDWYRSSLANLIEVLDTTPSDHRCLTFLPAPSPLVMWARRQASEVAVHRYDAEAARGSDSHFDVPFAVDMIDELLVGFASHVRTADVSDEHVLQVTVDDADDEFSVRIGPSGIRTDRRSGDADLRLSGSAADLYVALWNRPTGPTIRLEGDADVLDLWRRTCRIQWR